MPQKTLEEIKADIAERAGQINPLKRRIHIGRGFEKRPQRAPVTSHFLRAARHWISANAVIFVGEKECFAGLFLLALLF